MRPVLFKAAALLILIFLLDRGLSLIFSRVLFPLVLSGEAGGTLNYLLQKKKDTELIVLGSSRARYQIDPARLSGLRTRSDSAMDGYNAGIDGVGTLLYNSVVLDIALHEGLRPRYVILQTDARHFYEDGRSTEDALKSLIALYPFIEKSPLLEKYIREDLGFRERMKLLLHAYRYNGKVLNLLVNAAKRNSAPGQNGEQNGFVPLKGIMDSGMSVGDSEKPPHEYYRAALDSLNLKALRNLGALCRSRGIRLVVVFPPYWRNPEAKEYPASEAWRTLIRTLYGAGADRVYYFGDISLYPKLNSVRVWRDPSHLNGEGAAIFSEILNDSLRQMSAGRMRN